MTSAALGFHLENDSVQAMADSHRFDSHEGIVTIPASFHVDSAEYT